MIEIELLRFGDPSTLNLLGALDSKRELSVEKGECYWVGSISAEDEIARQHFLRSAAEGDIVALTSYSSMGDNLLYAVVVQDAVTPTRFHLFVIELTQGCDGEPRAVYGRALEDEYSITAAPPAKLPSDLVPNTRKLFWRSFLEVLPVSLKKHKDDQS